MTADRDFAQAGCLLSYGSSLPDSFRRAATYVDCIFKGAKAGDLPIEEPVKFDLVVNRGTARTLGLTIPQALLVSAAKVLVSAAKVLVSAAKVLVSAEEVLEWPAAAGQG